MSDDEAFSRSYRSVDVKAVGWKTTSGLCRLPDTQRHVVLPACRCCLLAACKSPTKLVPRVAAARASATMRDVLC